MSIRLIVNSDDYGRTADVSRGVREAHLRGIVTSTTCMMNMPTVAADIRLAMQDAPRLGLGVHLVLTSGAPLLPPSQVPSLIAPDGSFFKLDQMVASLAMLRIEEAKAEWRAQIEKFVGITGRNPTHLDSHHHSSYFTGGLFRAMLELAKEYSCAIRLAISEGYDESMDGIPSEMITPIQEAAPRLLKEFAPRAPDAFFASFYDERATKAELLDIIHKLPEGTYEVMCHPGYADAVLIAGSTINRQRETELDVLTDAEVGQAIQARGIKLISFAEL